MPLYGPPPKCPRTQRRAFQRYSEGRVEHFPIRKIQRNLGRIRIGCKVEDDRMRLRLSFYKVNLSVESRRGEVDEEPVDVADCPIKAARSEIVPRILEGRIHDQVVGAARRLALIRRRRVPRNHREVPRICLGRSRRDERRVVDQRTADKKRADTCRSHDSDDDDDNDDNQSPAALFRNRWGQHRRSPRIWGGTWHTLASPPSLPERTTPIIVP